MVDKIEKSKCTGCKMCADLCTKNAISFQTDKEGFWYPEIDIEKCTNCGLCVKSCPSLNIERVKSTNEPVVYAAWSKDGKNRHESTSGGIFYEVARLFIEKEGVVAGARYGNDWKSAEHFLAHNLEELEQLRGSKYFQSDTEGVYKAVKKEVENGKNVLFCGTPCQNAALAIYMGEEYSNLYYMDFICRSINSPLAFERYISELEELYGAEVVKVHLKNKKNGWQSLASQVCFSNGKESLRDKNQDWWVKGFLYNDLYTRESCYDCQYRTLPRKAADITVGDFWGITDESNYDMFQGISVVLVNSEKGMELFEEAKKFLYAKKKKIEEVLPGNLALLNNPKRNPQKDNFFELIKTVSFSEAVRSCIDTPKKQKKKKLLQVMKTLRKFKKKEISVSKYLHYNFFCKNIIRKGKAKIIPYKNAIIDLHPSSRIYIYGDKNFEVGTNKLKGSKAETHIRMDRDAVWNVYHGGAMSFNTKLEIHQNAIFNSGYFTVNGGSCITIDKKMTFGEDVMLGRNVQVYDSDFHQLQNDDGEQRNPAKEVVIEDHVWLTSNVMVLKGVTIGQGSLVAAQTVVNKSMPQHSVIAGKANGVRIKDSVNWSRKGCLKYSEILSDSKIILYGYGVIGKRFYEKHKENIAYIIDNFSKADGVQTFKEFSEKYPKLDENHIWVIASPNYFSAIYWEVKKAYPDMMIITAEL